MAKETNKIKVLQLFVANAKGGRTQYILNTWNYIDKDYFQFDFVTLSKELDFEKELIETGAKVFYVSCYAEENLGLFRKEITEILKNGYDVVHIHSSFLRSVEVEHLARAAGVRRIIIHSHNFGIGCAIDEKESEMMLKIHNRNKQELKADVADVFLACSNEAADFMYGPQIPTEKIRVIPNGIDLERFTYSESGRYEIRKEFSIREDEYVIGNVGRFVYQKNHDFLIDVFYEIAKKYSNVLLLLIGAGDLEDDIRKKVDKYGLNKRVLFAGKRNDLPKIYSAMDMFMLPSRFDGFPLSLIEAQAEGLPSIAGNVPQNAKLCEKTSILPLDKDIWINSFEKIYKNREPRTGLRKEQIEIHSIKRQVQELEKIYKEGL